MLYTLLVTAWHYVGGAGTRGGAVWHLAGSAPLMLELGAWSAAGPREIMRFVSFCRVILPVTCRNSTNTKSTERGTLTYRVESLLPKSPRA